MKRSDGNGLEAAVLACCLYSVSTHYHKAQHTHERKSKKRPRLSSPKREIDKAESTFSFSEKKVSTYTFSLYNPLSGILENEFKKNEMNMATAEVTAIL